MSNVGQQSQQISLPPIVKLIMPAQHALVILQALEERGPYREVFPVISNVQQQLIGQQAVPTPPAPEPPPIAGDSPDADHTATSPSASALDHLSELLDQIPADNASLDLNG